MQEEPPPPYARKTVLVLSSTYPRWKGDHEPNFVHELCKRLTPYHNVIVIAPQEKDALTQETMENVQVYRHRYAPNIFSTLISNGGLAANVKRNYWKWMLLPTFLLSQLLLTYKLAKKIQPDIIHAHWIIPQGIIATIVKLTRLRSAPLIITSHGGDLYTFNNKIFKYIKRLALIKAEVIAVVSPAMKEYFVNDPNINRKTYILPMGVDTKLLFTPKSEIFRNKKQILFIGRLVEKKGLEYLLKAMPEIIKKHPTSSLVIIGDGPYKDTLQKLAINLKINTKTNFLGGLPSAGLARYYQECSVLVAPFITSKSGDKEGLGLVIIEALSCNCPIVVSENESLREIRSIFKGNNWIRGVPERSPEAISLAVSGIMSSLETQQPLFTDQHRLIGDQYSWETTSKNYLIAYENLEYRVKIKKY